MPFQKSESIYKVNGLVILPLTSPATRRLPLILTGSATRVAITTRLPGNLLLGGYGATPLQRGK